MNPTPIMNQLRDLLTAGKLEHAEDCAESLNVLADEGVELPPSTNAWFDVAAHASTALPHCEELAQRMSMRLRFVGASAPKAKAPKRATPKRSKALDIEPAHVTF